MITRLLLLIFLAGLTGCTVGPDYSVPSAPLAPNYKELGDWQPAAPNDAAPRGAWWEIYHDPELNRLEQQVTVSNQNVLQAEAQFRAACALTRQSRAGYYPTLTANPALTLSSSASGGSGSRSSTGSSTSSSGDSSTRNSDFINGIGNQYNLPVEVSYLADVWGSVRRQVEESGTSAQASFAQLENLRLSYEAELAQDYFTLRGVDAEKELLDQTIQSYARSLELTTNQYNAGIVSKADVAQAQTQLDTTRAQLIDLDVTRAQEEHAIATLMGQAASTFSLLAHALEGTPPRIPVGVPATLLQRRPDIASAERQVASANAAIGVATAAYYPSITLTGQAGYESFQLSQIFSGPNFLWSLGPALAQTLFDGGRIQAEVLQARANKDATVAAYRQTVLTALQQVEDAIAGLRILEDENGVEDEAVKSAQQSLTIATNQYQAGTTSYLQVITAQTTALNDQVSALNIRTRRMTTSVQLLEALGGDWQVSNLPSQAQVGRTTSAEAPVTPAAATPAAAEEKLPR